MTNAFIACDADVRPTWLPPVTWQRGQEMIEAGEATQLLPRSHYQLVWATRHGETRWFVFPKGNA